MTYDAIVLGLGGMGSAALSHLARRGWNVLGLEQFNIGHALGSSHGQTRIIRTAYHEHPSYVPLVRRAFDLWNDLEQRRNEYGLLSSCSCINIGPNDGEVVRGVQAAAAQHDLPIETLSASEIQDRFPAFRVPPHMSGALESNAGILKVEECVKAHIADALNTGTATVQDHEPVLSWRAIGQGVEVTTAKGTYSAGKLIACAGAWATQTLKNLGVPLTVMRQVMQWFDPGPAAESFSRVRFPIFLVDSPEGFFYGMPRLDELGVKCARHYGAPELPSPEGVNREILPTDDAPVRNFLQQFLPDAAGPRTRAEVCMYTLTPDKHFVIDVHPEYPAVMVAAGFSGHGFKFAPVVGEILADLAEHGQTKHDIGLFSANRFR
jgi:sarcosine oxidase